MLSSDDWVVSTRPATHENTYQKTIDEIGRLAKARLIEPFFLFDASDYWRVLTMPRRHRRRRRK